MSTTEDGAVEPQLPITTPPPGDRPTEPWTRRSSGQAGDSRRQDPHIPFALNTAAAWSWRLLFVLIMAGVIVWLSRPVSTILVGVAVAALLAGLLTPAVRWLRKHRIGSGWATAITEIGLIVVVLGLLTLVGQQLVSGFTDLSDQVVAGYHQLMDWLADGRDAVYQGQSEPYDLIILDLGLPGLPGLEVLTQWRAAALAYMAQRLSHMEQRVRPK